MWRPHFATNGYPRAVRNVAHDKRELEQKLERLVTLIAPLKRVIVAFSGGVDSALVLKVAYDILGKNVLAVTAVSPSLPQSELRAAQAVAERIGARHRLLDTHELDNKNYAANGFDRCYFCKTTLYDTLERVAAAEGIDVILNGTNVDDLGDVRPGLKAATEKGIKSPLKDAALGKQDVRDLAHHLDLYVWDKPAMACLSSRIPYGTPVTVEALGQIEAAEVALRQLGFRQLRVRHHSSLARIELPLKDLPRALDLREVIVDRFKAIGYTFVSLDLAGFRSGSSNEAIEHGKRIPSKVEIQHHA